MFMDKPNKVRIDVYIDAMNYSKILEYANKIGARTASQAVNTMLNEYFLDKDGQAIAVERLTKVIQNYENKVRNLELEVRTKALKSAEVIK